MDTNRYGKLSELSIAVSRGQRRSRIESLHFTAPFKLARPFYDENEKMQIMMLNVSAGIMAGDRQRIDISILDKARAEITSQSFEKIHKMEQGNEAVRETMLTVGSGGTLIYSPQPTIPFAESAFRNTTDIRLADESAKLFYSEIISCGRVERNERFQYRYYKTLTRVYRGDRLIYFDNCCFDSDESKLEGLCMFEGYSHFASLILMNLKLGDEMLEYIRTAIAGEKSCTGAVSITGSGDVCIRVLGNRAEDLQRLEGVVKGLLD
ncbi:MAG: urease accessory protein UreD [Lachnospiraceae bacterium]